MHTNKQLVTVPEQYSSVKVEEIKKRIGPVFPNTVVCVLSAPGHPQIPITSPGYGRVTIMCQIDAALSSGAPLFELEHCKHDIVMLGLCAECGANLKQAAESGERILPSNASIAMVHTIPDLHVSEAVAARVALEDERRLLSSRKLVLLIDLDQTVLHTTVTSHAFKYKDVHRFKLGGCDMIYHTRFRPHLRAFLSRLVKRFEMHICTFGNRAYAHQLASILDPDGKLFSERILSRDECFNPVTKSANLKALFPRGVHLVCIIDDRGDVWEWSPNLIQVQPYRFFPDVGDINTPLGRPVSLLLMPDCRILNSESPEPFAGPSMGGEATTSATAPTEESKSDEKEAERVVKTEEPCHKDKEQTDKPAQRKEDQPGKEDEKPSMENQEEASPTVVKGETEAVGKSENEDEKKVDPADAAESLSVEHLSGPKSALEMTEAELDAFDADYLLRLEEILTEIHRRYYRAYDKYLIEVNRRKSLKTPIPEGSRLSGIPHVANVMTAMRSRVLGPSTHITLSGLTPRSRPAQESLAGQIALGLGATLHNHLRLPKELGKPENGKFTTHLVACRQNTEKVIAALDFQQKQAVSPPSPPLELYIVSPRWLWASHFRWKRMPEAQFPLDHDFSVLTFDPDGGLIKPLARHDRHQYPHHHHHHHRYYGRHHRRHGREADVQRPHQRVERKFFHRKSFDPHHRSGQQQKETDETLERLAGLPQKEALSASMVLDAMASIEEELRADLERKPASDGEDDNDDFESRPGSTDECRRKRTLSESACTSQTPVSRSKRVCHVKSDNRLEVPQLEAEEGTSGEQEAKAKEEEPRSSSLPTDSDRRENAATEATSEVASSPPEQPSRPDGSARNNVAIISDTDEDGLESTVCEDDDVAQGEEDESAAATEGDDDEIDREIDCRMRLEAEAGEEDDGEDEEEDLSEVIKQYLPPPCPLDLADNPLLHMSPMATSEMLDEVEEAIEEEREERAASVPRELLDEIRGSESSSSDSSTSPSSSSGHRRGASRRGRRDLEDEDSDGDLCETYDDETLGLDGSTDEDEPRGGASKANHEKELRYLEIRQQLLLRHGGNNRRALAAIRRRIHKITPRSSFESGLRLAGSSSRGDSSPGARRQRAIVVPEMLQPDQREFNTCPEGYDYVDAERSRRILRPETGGLEEDSDQETPPPVSKSKAKRAGRKKNKKSGEKESLRAMELSLFGSDVSSASSSSSTTSDNDDGDDAGGGTILSAALREFM